MQIFPHGDSHPGAKPQHQNSRPVEPIAVFFMEDGMDVMIKESKLTDAQRADGGYMLIGTGLGAHWVPKNIDGAFRASRVTGMYPPAYETNTANQQIGAVFIGHNKGTGKFGPHVIKFNGCDHE